MTTPKIEELKAAWLSAKESESAWTNHRRGIEDQMREELSEQIGAALSELDNTTALTTSFDLGDDVTLKIGYSLDISQVDAVRFMGQHPQLLGILFKNELKPDSRAVLKTLNSGGALGDELDAIVNFKPLNPSFAKK